MPGFVDDETLKGRLRDLLQVVGQSLQPFWDSIISDSNESAYSEIVAALSGRKFSAAQIAAWDRGAEFQMDIALHLALVKGGATKDWDPEFIDRLDRRPQLAGDASKGIAAVQVTNGRVEVYPLDPVTGDSPIGFGRLHNRNDRHTMRGDGVNPEAPSIRQHPWWLD